MITIAFDIYGTLIDTSSILPEIRKHVHKKAEEFNETWRQKQLEYSFRFAAMRKYMPFSYCTRKALDYSDTYHQTQLQEDQKGRIINAYKSLSAFEEVKEVMKELAQTKNYELIAFSNGDLDAIEDILNLEGIKPYFNQLISTSEVESFKPDPVVYQLLEKKATAKAQDIYLVSSNPFDISGAKSYGLKTIWIKRDEKKVFDPLPYKPDHIAQDLSTIRSFL